MSIGKVDEAVGNLGDDFIGLTVEQIKEKILAEFHTTYGRYENVSSTMALELSHAEGQAGMVHSVQLEEDKITDDVVISREDAIQRFILKMKLGYRRIFEGLTDEDLERGNIIRIANKSAIDKEGLLGTYVHRNKEFLRVKEHGKGLFTIEKGYDGSLSSCDIEQSEATARTEIAFALDAGFYKQGTELPDEPKSNRALMAFFGEEEPEPEVIEKGAFNPAWFN